MKKVLTGLLSLFIASLFFVACDDEESHSDNFLHLTGAVWQSDSLLINGMDASGPGDMLEDFAGEARFNEDGTGTFGQYEGTWTFASNETQLVLESSDLPIPRLSTNIIELTAQSLKVTTSFPDLENPGEPPLQIRLTFNAQ